MTIFVADCHATGAAVSLVVGVERARKTRGRCTRVGVGELESLHRRSEVGRRIKERFMIVMEKIVLCYFREVRRWRRFVDLRCLVVLRRFVTRFLE
jgi:hypothetical protein